MGKAGRWLRHFLPSRRDRANKHDKPAAGEADKVLPLPPEVEKALLTTATTTPASTPGAAKEKRRWSFRRPAVTASPSPAKDAGAGTPGTRRAPPYGFLEPRVDDPDSHAVAVAIATAAAAEAAMAAKHHHATSIARMSASRRAVMGIEDAAAIKIQAAFRAHLARTALCALRGLVKLQALVRGHLVRRQAGHTLRCMQALVAAQHRARVARLRLLEEDGEKTATRPATPGRRASSPCHRPRSRHNHQEAEENVKIVEVDTGGRGFGGEAYATPRTASSRRSSCYATPLCRTPSKAELYGSRISSTTPSKADLYGPKISPTPSALTDASGARAYSGRYDYDFSFATANARAASPYNHHHYAADRATPTRQDGHHALAFVPSYMANTQSSRAKARSQSAPRQRHSVSSAGIGDAQPWERRDPIAGGGGRRRTSLEGGGQTPGARGTTPRCGGGVVRVQRCPSQAASEACPWGARMMDRWHDSECGSTSTVMTAATTTYCWSMATDNTGMA